MCVTDIHGVRYARVVNYSPPGPHAFTMTSPMSETTDSMSAVRGLLSVADECVDQSSLVLSPILEGI